MLYETTTGLPKAQDGFARYYYSLFHSHGSFYETPTKQFTISFYY